MKKAHLALSVAAGLSMLGVSAMAVSGLSGNPDANLFQLNEVTTPLQVAEGEHKCGSGSCGSKDGEHKCDHKDHDKCDHKCGSGSCGSKDGEHKCGSGSCGSSN